MSKLGFAHCLVTSADKFRENVDSGVFAMQRDDNILCVTLLRRARDDDPGRFSTVMSYVI